MHELREAPEPTPRRAGGPDEPGRPAARRRLQASPAREDRSASAIAWQGSCSTLTTRGSWQCLQTNRLPRRCRCCRSAIRPRSRLSFRSSRVRRNGPAQRRLLCLRRHAARRGRRARTDRERVTPVVEAETLPLAAACGRILAQDLVAGIDVPPHPNSAVDGFAVAHADLLPDRETVLPVTGRAAAGHPLGRRSPGARRSASSPVRRCRWRRHGDDAGGLRLRRRAGTAQTRHQKRRQQSSRRRGCREGRVALPPGGASGRPISAWPRRSDRTRCRYSGHCGRRCCRPATRCCEPGHDTGPGPRSTTPTGSCWQHCCADSAATSRSRNSSGPRRGTRRYARRSERRARSDRDLGRRLDRRGGPCQSRDREARAPRFLAARDQAGATGRARAESAACR